MYDKRKRRWVSGKWDEELIRWCHQNPSDPEAKYIIADGMLEELKDGSNVAEAVAMMISAAEEGHPRAMFAVGQMYQYGWSVHKDKKTAMEWYNKAAKAGSLEAQSLLRQRKRRRWITAGCLLGTVLLCAALVLGTIMFIRSHDGKLWIRVHGDTQLIETTTLDEYADELRAVIREYDGQLTISEETETNRLLLRFDGETLDLRDFPAARVISREDGRIVIQFTNPEDTQKCLNWLQELDNVVYVQQDSYRSMEQTDGSNLPILTTVDPQQGVVSWGVLDMGLDQLSEYVGKTYPDRQVTVGVIDSGVLPTMFEGNRIIEAVNVMDGNNQFVPGDHGSHVTGTILDGTRGTNTYIVSFDMYGSNDLTNDSIWALTIETAADYGVDVISMSQGWQYEHISLVEDAINYALAQGVIFVNSAGNESIDVNTGFGCPSHMEDLIVVGAHDINHKEASFTNYGASVDVCAPGVAIYSASHYDPNQYVKMNGTSMSTPHVAALAALLKIIRPDATQEQVEQLIKDCCRTNRNPDLYATGLFGAGAPDATAFIEKHN